MNRLLQVLLTAGLVGLPSVIWAGPNEGGVLILHANEDLVTSTSQSYCGQAGLTSSCHDADVRVDGTEECVFFVFAAFPAENDPRLLGLTFGIYYDDDAITIGDYGGCGDLELPMTTWPAPETGVAVTWDVVNTEHLVEVYWFAGYTYAVPTVFELGENPIAGSQFADDEVPPNLDDVADYGALGFGTDGYLPCPDPPVPTLESSWGQVKDSFR